MQLHNSFDGYLLSSTAHCWRCPRPSTRTATSRMASTTPPTSPPRPPNRPRFSHCLHPRPLCKHACASKQAAVPHTRRCVRLLCSPLKRRVRWDRRLKWELGRTTMALVLSMGETVTFAQESIFFWDSICAGSPRRFSAWHRYTIPRISKRCCQMRLDVFSGEERVGSTLDCMKKR